MRILRRVRRTASAALVLGCVTCGGDAPFTIAVAPDATLPAPAFTVDGRQPPQFIFVERLIGTTASVGTEVWALVKRRDDPPALPVRMTYGVPPQGYREGAPARTLGPGEYRVRAKSVEQQAELAFTVAPDGRIVSRR